MPTFRRLTTDPAAEALPEATHGHHTSPLFDIRALGGSTLFHTLLLALASGVVITAALPRDRAESRILQGEVGPIDNRATNPGEAGGAPGELGGQGHSADSREIRRMLDEVLSPRATVDLPRWLRPRSERGIGVLPGPGLGGGGGTGGGSGAGQGSGVGPGTEFFGTKVTATSLVYVIDRSGSMTNRDSLGVAKRELLNSLDDLAEDAQFAVLFYDTRAEFADGPQMTPASREHKARLHARLERIEPDGGTDHKVALLPALKLRPEVVFFLTDADQMTDGEADDILKLAGSTRIQAIEFGVGPAVVSSKPLRRLATATGGNYRYIDVTTFR